MSQTKTYQKQDIIPGRQINFEICLQRPPVNSYLGSKVVGVVSLRGSEVGTEHRFRHVNSDLQVLHSLAHGLLRADCDVQPTGRSRLKEVDVLLHVHWNGHEAEKGSKQT